MDKKKLKDNTINFFETNDKVIYIPCHLLINDKTHINNSQNFGIVISKNEKYIFVKFIGCNSTHAIRPEHLYFLDDITALKKLLLYE